MRFISVLLVAVCVFVAACSDSVMVEEEPEQELDYARMVNEVVESPEFKKLLDLRQESLDNIFDAIDRGVKKSDIATAFKVEIGLIREKRGITSLSNAINLREDFEGELESTLLSLRRKFPNLGNEQSKSVFENECTPTEEKVDFYFENIENFRGFEFSSIVANKTFEDDDECQACGQSCAAVYTTLGCSLVGCIVSSWTILGCGFSIWGCACAVCPEDLPSWLGRGPCGGDDDG